MVSIPLTLDGTRFQCLSDLLNAHPSYTIDPSVQSKLSESPAWEDIRQLPTDAASACMSRSEYENLAPTMNNAIFGKYLTLEEGSVVCWNGALSLYSTAELDMGSEILATRGWDYWSTQEFKSKRTHGV